jgi:GNAT superfamily N-acetyltransferase
MGGVKEAQREPSASPSTVVRVATSSDLSAVVAMRIALLREYADHPIYGRLHPDAEARAREIYARQIAASDQAILLAEIGSSPVGILRCVEVLASPLLDPARYCYVSSVYVEPSRRHRGVLRTLLEHAEDWAVFRGLSEIRLHNSSRHPDAVATWDALGFEVVEQVRFRKI